MLTAEVIRWTAIAAITAAVLRLPRPLGFWSHEADRPLVLARMRRTTRVSTAARV